MSIYSIDYETTSACDIKFGAARYACDPTTRILMFAIAEDDDQPYLWRFDDPFSDESLTAVALFQKAVSTESLIYSHNASFEFFVTKYCLTRDTGITPPALHQWRCTAAMCRTASIPYSLAKAAEFLKLGTDKDARGKALIGIFSDQTKVSTLKLDGKETMKSASPIMQTPVPWDAHVTVAGQSITVREAWDMFCAYCIQDVRVEQQLHRAMAKFELKGSELEGFQFDLAMNDRGIPVNLPALHHAQKIVEMQREYLEREFVSLTGLSPTQTAKVLEWLQQNGYPADNLQAATMEENLSGSFLTPEGNRALEIRSQLSFAAVKKIPAMINTACPDGRMRGLFMWYGAMATGRWSSGGPQMQNAKKPTIKNPDEAYAAICEQWDPEIFGFMFGNPYEAVASCIRNFVQPEKGMLIDLDYSNIESRVAAALAGQEDLLDVYRQGRDAYKELASEVFGVPVDQVTKEQRFVGKVGNLSLVFQTGAKTFHETCATWGMPIEKSVACKTVKTFREKYDQFPATWRRYESAAVKAIKNPGEWFPASDFVAFGYSRAKPFQRLMMRLPSGRCLQYPLAEVRRTVKRHKDYETGESREWESDDITFYGPLKGHVGYGRISTYAGSLFQSSVQATARDILQHGCVLAEKAGYKIIAVIHDQCLAEEGDPDELLRLLCTHPEWLSKDFPIAAAGGLVKYYAKD
jgi:DNA polymerase